MTILNQEQRLLHPPKWWQLLKDGEYLTNKLRRNDLIEATVLALSDRDVWVDLDGKRDGVVPRQDLEHVDADYLAQLKVGDNIPVRILRIPFDRSGVLVSLKQGLEQQDWVRAKKLLAAEKVVTVTIVDTNRGGILAEFGRIRGFIPNSHLISIPRNLGFQARQARKPDLVGKTLDVIVIEVNRRRRRLILSERQARKKRAVVLLAEIHEGQVRVGTVVNMTNYGAFVDLGGVSGLLHISEISWNHVRHPQDVFEVGEEITVYVLNVDRERKRISLTQKLLLSPPGIMEARNGQGSETLLL